MIFCWLFDRLYRKSTPQKSFSQKKITEISSHEEFHCKTMQISEENELYEVKWK